MADQSGRGTLTTDGVVEKNKDAAQAPATSAETVTVACKLPNGLIMRLYSKVDVDYPMFGGGFKTVAEFRPREGVQTYELNGFSHHQEQAPEYAIAGGFALTSGIPKDFWLAWAEQNKQADFIKNGLVFASSTENSARSAAKERRDVKSGLERIDPNNLPAAFKGKIEKHDSKAA